jgi:hypothetical protein
LKQKHQPLSMNNFPVTNSTPSWDVLVAGGGMAGIAAAITSARLGARTILVERYGWLGGIGVSGATGLHSFYNIFEAHNGAERLRLADGIAQELVNRTVQLGGGIGHIPMERGGDFVSMLTPVEPEIFKLAAFELCQEAGVHLLLHTIIEDLQSSQGQIEFVNIWNKGGKRTLHASQFVDCTGDGDLAAWAGASYQAFQPGEAGAYSAGFTFRLCNIELDQLEADLEARGLITQLAHAIKPGTSKPDLVRLGINMYKLREQGFEAAPHYFLSSSLRPRELTYCNCINYGPIDGCDTDALTAAEGNLRRQMLEIAAFFRENFKGCKNCYPAGAAPAVGPRRGRAIHCHYELTESDCTSGRQFADQIGCFGFIDNPRLFVNQAGAYGIPYRALLPQGLVNTLIAGRMMTIDLGAHNSTRNTVCCLICGQAAGTAAALASTQKINPDELDASHLQAVLKENHVLLQPRAEPL